MRASPTVPDPETLAAAMDRAQVAILHTGWAAGYRCKKVEYSPTGTRYIRLKHTVRGPITVRIGDHPSPVPATKQLDCVVVFPGSLRMVCDYVRDGRAAKRKRGAK